MRSAVAEFLDSGDKADGECRIRSRERRGRDRDLASLDRRHRSDARGARHRGLDEIDVDHGSRTGDLHEASATRRAESAKYGDQRGWNYAPFRSRFAAQAGSRVYAAFRQRPRAIEVAGESRDAQPAEHA